MKTVILALFVLLVVSHGEALRCNCGGLRSCLGGVETCFGSNSVCATVIFYGSTPRRYLKGCMSSSECRLRNRPGISSSSCCRSDRCNR